ncbi:MAG TPA: S41 family peptidase [Candidatus Dojkabacteria bacterium]|jgi:carboxyl-terminal processing protease|nr:S41 family peptidase [Candidatus Dojkabacteria bacterium]
MENEQKKNSKILGVSLLVIFVFVIGILVGRNYSEGEASKIFSLSSDEKSVNMDLFWDVWNTTKKFYVDSDKLEEESMVYGAIKGMVESISDVGTTYLDPKETEEYNSASEGKYFEGIGAELGYLDNQVIVVAPIEGSPAKAAGIRPGDYILKIDDYALTSEDTVYDAVAKIRGEKGTKVRLTVLHRGDKEPVEIEITRSEITVPSMTLNFIGEKKDIAHLKVARFTDSSLYLWEQEWDKSVQKINQSGVNKVILDLRSNPGGFFDAAIYAVDDILDEGYVISQQQDSEGNVQEYKSEKGGNLLGKNIIVLIDEGSASASEIVSGALQQSKKATLIGKSTFGKGTAQKIFNFSDGSSLHLTIVKWLLPDGKNIDRENPILPDIEVSYTNEDFEKGKDPQLEKAIEELSK